MAYKDEMCTYAVPGIKLTNFKVNDVFFTRKTCFSIAKAPMPIIHAKYFLSR